MFSFLSSPSVYFSIANRWYFRNAHTWELSQTSLDCFRNWTDKLAVDRLVVENPWKYENKIIEKPWRHFATQASLWHVTSPKHHFTNTSLREKSITWSKKRHFAKNRQFAKKKNGLWKENLRSDFLIFLCQVTIFGEMTLFCNKLTFFGDVTHLRGWQGVLLVAKWRNGKLMLWRSDVSKWH